ncbi:CAP domain-containing protein [Aggregatibacter kilianii]|uniref:CAP domain-containing protein n=1 Tax=Aggregatibacter kilianii TaxID=2025884 RepID=UPI000D641EDC|nr:CAP domain-containing protein [Aggregatibacter kilianii]
MKPRLTGLLLAASFFTPILAYAEVGEVYKIREFSYRNAEEKAKLEEAALKLLRSAYDGFPDVDNCYAGNVTSEQKRRVLKELNAIRRTHGLEEVAYDSSKDRATAASALISAANNRLDHYPNKRMKCYSQAGYDGSSQSNLAINNSSSPVFIREDAAERVVDQLIIDDNVYSLGHRLWFLDPFLGSISYGRATKIDRNKYVADAASIYVGNARRNILNTKANYVAYPYQNYKANWFLHDWFHSFSVIVDKNEKYINRTSVDYSHAEIRVSSADGRTMKVSDISYSIPNARMGYAGLGNAIQWRVSGTRNNERYYVRIKNVLVNGIAKDYEYWFNVQGK